MVDRTKIGNLLFAVQKIGFLSYTDIGEIRKRHPADPEKFVL